MAGDDIVDAEWEEVPDHSGNLHVAKRSGHTSNSTNPSGSTPSHRHGASGFASVGLFFRGLWRVVLVVLGFLVLLIAIMAFVPAPGSNSGPDDDRATTTSANPALAACQRADVQDVVGKETRGKLYKAALPRLVLQEWMGFDSNRAIADFDNAVVTFDHVSLDTPGALGVPPSQQIVCTGQVQIDMSNATAGQQIIGIEGLRWVINFSGEPADPATDAFTVEVDDASIQQGLTVNGRSPVAPQSQEQADLSASEVEDTEPAAANSAADQAARAAAEAQAAVAQAEAEIGSEPQASTQQRKTNNQPSAEDLYAPH